VALTAVNTALGWWAVAFVGGPCGSQGRHRRALDKAAQLPRTFIPHHQERPRDLDRRSRGHYALRSATLPDADARPMGVTVRASRVGLVGTAVLLPAWTKRRHVDLCRTHAALCR
jgi:hypothetical protein